MGQEGIPQGLKPAFVAALNARAKEGAEKVECSERRRTSAAEAARQNRTYGTAEAVPLTKTRPFSVPSQAKIATALRRFVTESMKVLMFFRVASMLSSLSILASI